MPEYRKMIFKPKEDLWPYLGLRSFERRNLRAIVEPANGDIWKYRCLQGYNALWYAGMASGVILALSYAAQ